MTRGMEIIAHRGASHDAPENTLAAIRLGWAQGADAVEIKPASPASALLRELAVIRGGAGHFFVPIAGAGSYFRAHSWLQFRWKIVSRTSSAKPSAG